MQIVSAKTEEEIREASLLFREYVASLSVNLSFQDFEKEVAGLPGNYSSPDGRLFIAYLIGEHEKNSFNDSAKLLVGSVALRKIDSLTCEMKRLFLRPQFRGRGLGRALANAAIEAAREIGYTRMLLDTLPEMERAQELYRELGFQEIPAYRFNPIPGARFMARTL
jgi:ribosomal protein S18 acetylase RimI-like enzyme